ncbi:uncharacterized protein [Watersipora subatra]|uniref:uncharacterized protein n=1 Tax=Watersipora subatra TaxID=2589382 RepID=UPI00355AE8B9
MKLELASQDSMQTTTKSLKNVSKDKPACQAEKLKSFSNFGRTGTVSNFELYRHKLLQNYLDVVLPKGLDEPGTEDEYELAPETRSTSQDSIRLSQFHNASSRQLTSTLLAANGKINLEITNLSKPNEEERDSNITLSDKSIANDVLDEDLIVNTND